MVFSNIPAPPGLDQAAVPVSRISGAIPFVQQAAGTGPIVQRIQYQEKGGWMLTAPELSKSILCPHETRQLTLNRKPSTRSRGGFNDGRPSTGPSVSGAEEISVSGQFAARYADEDLKQLQKLFIKMDTQITSLKRKPLITLEWNGLSITGFFGKLDFSFVDGVWPSTGNWRRMNVSFSVVEARLATFKPVISRPRETRYRWLADGETFEHVAAALYGTPLKGDLLRRINHQTPLTGEVAQTRIIVFEPDHPAIQQDIVPVSAVFQGDGYRSQIQEAAVDLETRSSIPLAQLREELGLG